MARETNEPRRIKEGDIVPLGYFMERARATLDVQRGAGVSINPDDVPPTLRHLIPFVGRWAIRGSGPQIVFIEQLQDVAPSDIDAFCDAMRPHLDEIREWNRQSLATKTAGDAVSHFVYALGAYELAKPMDPDQIVKNHQNAELWRKAEARKQAIADSADAFRTRRFDEVVRLLQPYEAELPEIERKRLEIAKKRQS